jgi:hypothetical protein
VTISRRLKKFVWQGRLQWHDSEGRSWYYYRCKEVVQLFLFLRGDHEEYYMHVY